MSRIKYKEKGFTRGEIRRIKAKPKPEDAPVDISFGPSWIDKLGALDVTKLPAEQIGETGDRVDGPAQRGVSEYQVIEVMAALD